MQHICNLCVQPNFPLMSEDCVQLLAARRLSALFFPFAALMDLNIFGPYSTLHAEMIELKEIMD